MITGQILGDKEVVAHFEAMPAKVHAALVRKTQSLSVALARHIQEQKLSGQVLKVRTGNLRRSIAFLTTDEGDRITGKAYSSGDVKYAAIHEFGGKTAAHDIVPKKAQFLAFMVGGKQVFAKIVHHPGSVMPERSFMRSSLAEMRPEIIDGLRQAAVDAMRGE